MKYLRPKYARFSHPPGFPETSTFSTLPYSILYSIPRTLFCYSTLYTLNIRSPLHRHRHRHCHCLRCHPYGECLPFRPSRLPSTVYRTTSLHTISQETLSALVNYVLLLPRTSSLLLSLVLRRSPPSNSSLYSLLGFVPSCPVEFHQNRKSASFIYPLLVAGGVLSTLRRVFGRYSNGVQEYGVKLWQLISFHWSSEQITRLGRVA